MDAPVEESPGRQYHRATPKADSGLCYRTAHPIAVQEQVVHGLLEQPKIRLIFEAPTDRPPIQNAIGLCARRPHGRPLGAIEDAELDACFVRGSGHRTAKRIDFLDQMPLADPADRGVARHLPEGFDAVRQQHGASAHPGRGQRRFGTGVTAADHDDIEPFWKVHCSAARGGAEV